MTTNKQRINITASPEIEQALKLAAKRAGVPVATKAAELLSIAISLEEDYALAALANQRASTPKRSFIPHDKAWN